MISGAVSATRPGAESGKGATMTTDEGSSAGGERPGVRRAGRPAWTIARPAARSPRRRAAFTIIELMVVVAIIALLVAILVPMLQEAKESAREALCVANLRQISAVLVNYSQSFEGRIPLAYNNSRQVNHAIWYGGVPGHRSYTPIYMRGFGELIVTRQLDTPELLYCPSVKQPKVSRFPGYFRYDVPENPWPPVNYTSSWSSYGTRPMAQAYCSGWGWQELPMLDEVSPDKAAVSDLTGVWGCIATRHVDGVFVGYVDGAVHWVGVPAINRRMRQEVGDGSWVAREYGNQLQDIDRVVYHSWWGSFGYEPTWERTMSVWYAFDEQR
jgi:prepilin-type N-terminal cleavage/methylation domain-containing protein